MDLRSFQFGCIFCRGDVAQLVVQQQIHNKSNKLLSLSVLSSLPTLSKEITRLSVEMPSECICE